MPEQEKEKEPTTGVKGRSLREVLNDIPTGGEISFIIVYREYNPDNQSVENRQRQFIIKDFGTANEKVFYIQQQPRRTMPGPVPGRA